MTSDRLAIAKSDASMSTSIRTSRDATSSGRLAAKEASLKRLRQSEALHIVSRHATLERARVERFIEKRFFDSFRSVIVDHYPTLLSLQNGNGDVLATVGLRYASDEVLFLERYFDEPIECVIEKAIGVAPARSEVLEIGNFASIGRTASARLIVASALYLRTCGCRYAVVTATQELRRMLGSFGFSWTALAAARPEKLPDLGRSWGSYYDQDPRILVGEIEQAFFRMQPSTTRMETD